MTSAALLQGVEEEAEAPGLEEEAEVMLYTETLYFKQKMLLSLLFISVLSGELISNRKIKEDLGQGAIFVFYV